MQVVALLNTNPVIQHTDSIKGKKLNFLTHAELHKTIWCYICKTDGTDTKEQNKICSIKRNIM